jgi:glycosyltransferase involved in cell wall biosynthesis
MKRLVIASDSFLPRWDGVARFLSEIIPKLTDSYRITVIAPAFPGKKPRTKGVKLVTIPLSRISINAYTLPKYRPKVVEEQVGQADLVWTHTIGPIGGAAIRAARQMNVPVVCYIHSVEWELLSRSMPKSVVLRASSTALTRKLARNLYNQADLLLVPSEEVSWLLGKNHIRTPTTLVPMGVDPRKFRPPKSKSAAKKRVRLPTESYVIGFCGRIAREKDLPTLYKAFRKHFKEHPETHLLLIGSGLKRLGFKHANVHFKGAVDNVLPHLQAMDVFVLPSLTETSSLSTMEAMACGVPAIVTPVGNIISYVKDGHNGFVFPKRDSETLGWHLNNLMDKGLRESLGRNARATIRRCRSWSLTVKEVRNVLKSSGSRHS